MNSGVCDDRIGQAALQCPQYIIIMCLEGGRFNCRGVYRLAPAIRILLSRLYIAITVSPSPLVDAKKPHLFVECQKAMLQGNPRPWRIEFTLETRLWWM